MGLRTKDNKLPKIL